MRRRAILGILVTSAFLFAVLSSRPLRAEQPGVHRVTLETSATEARAPGLVGVTIRLFDQQNRVIRVDRMPETWSVHVARGRAPLSVNLTPYDSSRAVGGELNLRTPGLYSLRARVTQNGEVLAESDIVTVTATSQVNFGVIRSGETVCRPLPGGGRGLLGEVVPGHGELPQGVSIWGGCLVADDSAERSEGSVRAAVVVMSGSGQGRDVERRFYQMFYRIEPRIMTPRRIFFGFCVAALLGLVFAVIIAVREPRRGFGHGAAFAWTTVTRSPYRDDQVPQWTVTELDAKESSKGWRRSRRSLDVAMLVGTELLEPGLLRIRPLDDGQVEVRGPRGEELRAVTPDGRVEVDDRRLVVPFGSTVTYRNVAFAPLIGDDAAAVLRGEADRLTVPQV